MIKKFSLNNTPLGKSLHIVGKVVEWAVFILIIFIGLTVLSPYLPTKNLLVTYIVSTGSMEPTVKTGAIAFVVPVKLDAIKEGDIITFKSPKNAKDTILHRVNKIVVKDNKTVLITKGDNNNAPDNWEVKSDAITGKFNFSIPYIGHPAALLKTPWGFAGIVGIPSIYLIFLFIQSIKQGINEEILKKAKSISQHQSTSVMAIVLVILGILSGCSSFQLYVVQAKYFSNAVLQGATFHAKDFAPPQNPTLLSPASNSNLNTANLLFSWTAEVDYANMNNPVTYNLTLCTDLYCTLVVNTWTGLTTTLLTPPPLPEGDYWWKVTACDALGNCSENSGTRKFIIDNTPPVASVGIGNNGADGTRQNMATYPEPIVNTPVNASGPTHNATITGTKNIYITATDLYMQSFHFRVLADNVDEKTFGKPTGYNVGGYAYSNYVADGSLLNNGRIVSLDTTQISNGTYWLIVSAVDIAGNRSVSGTDPYQRDARIKVTIANALSPTATPTVAPTATPTVAPTATPTVAPTATPAPCVPTPTFTLSSDKKSVSFSVSCVEAYSSAKYTISYDTTTLPGIPQGIIGDEESTGGASTYTKTNIPLKTCSAGGCIEHENPSNLILTIVLNPGTITESTVTANIP
ncbi:MAG: signal peptidase I [Candidatus Roizmanbacteria bacterium]